MNIKGHPSTGEIKSFNKLIIVDRNGVQISKKKLDELVERLNQQKRSKDLDQAIDLLSQLYRYL